MKSSRRWLIVLSLVLLGISPVTGAEDKGEEKNPPPVNLTAEDREIIENIDLLELMQLLQDLELVASLEEEQ